MDLTAPRTAVPSLSNLAKSAEPTNPFAPVTNVVMGSRSLTPDRSIYVIGVAFNDT